MPPGRHAHVAQDARTLSLNGGSLAGPPAVDPRGGVDVSGREAERATRVP